MRTGAHNTQTYHFILSCRFSFIGVYISGLNFQSKTRREDIYVVLVAQHIDLYILEILKSICISARQQEVSRGRIKIRFIQCQIYNECDNVKFLSTQFLVLYNLVLTIDLFFNIFASTHLKFLNRNFFTNQSYFISPHSGHLWLALQCIDKCTFHLQHH